MECFHRYYFNKVTKESKWTIPEELKVCNKLDLSFSLLCFLLGGGGLYLAWF